MTRRSLSLPLTLIAAFAVLLILLMAEVLPSAVLVAQVSSCPDETYPNLSYADCKATQQAGTSGPAPSNTTGSGGTGGGNSQPSQATSTPTITRTVTITAGTSQATATLGASLTPTLTRAPAETAAATPTAELPDGVEALTCMPGETVRLTGEAEPGTALLAYFNDRPVGGGFARPDGQFTIDLLIGEERPGSYLVEVRDRATRALILQLGCEVPALTPTPTRFIVP